MKFTQTTIAKFKIEAGKSEHIEFDESMPGFGLRIRVGTVDGDVENARVHDVLRFRRGRPTAREVRTRQEAREKCLT